MLRRLIHYANYNPLVSGLLVLLNSGGFSTLWLAVKDPASRWFWTDARVSWGGMALIALVMLAALTVIIGLTSALRRERAQATTAATPQAPVRFAPDTFGLTPPRCRALLTLIQRVDAPTTLDHLHRLASASATYVGDRPITKGQLQHDMEDAERAGIVAIDRASPIHYYKLAISAGRDWVLGKEAALKAGAGRTTGLAAAATPPKTPFTPTADQAWALRLLLGRWPDAYDLAGLCVLLERPGETRAHVAAHMDGLVHRDLVSERRGTGPGGPYVLYTLTDAGRSFAIEQVAKKKE